MSNIAHRKMPRFRDSQNHSRARRSRGSCSGSKLRPGRCPRLEALPQRQTSKLFPNPVHTRGATSGFASETHRKTAVKHCLKEGRRENGVSERNRAKPSARNIRREILRPLPSMWRCNVRTTKTTTTQHHNHRQQQEMCPAAAPEVLVNRLSTPPFLQQRGGSDRPKTRADTSYTSRINVFFACDGRRGWTTPSSPAPASPFEISCRRKNNKTRAGWFWFTCVKRVREVLWLNSCFYV